MSQPGVREPQADRTALFFEFGVALDERLQRLEEEEMRNEHYEEDCRVNKPTHTHSNRFSTISTKEEISAGAWRAL